MKYNLKVKNFGQVREADIKFGDLTVFIGPQATGKSIILQLFKLLLDRNNILSELKKHGLDWERNTGEFFNTYFGEGMHSLWNKNKSDIKLNNDSKDIEQLVLSKIAKQDEKVFFIPAQRVLALRDGWPRPFTDYSAGDPFTVREYSEKLRLLMEKEFNEVGKNLFPQAKRLKNEIKDAIDNAIFHGFGLKVDRMKAQKRLALSPGRKKDVLPYMVWSAGQREFVPLLLGLYWLLPSSRIAKRKSVDWVIIEELEMGLHPKAITAAMLLVMDLLKRGYRVCISTHSPQVLDVIWSVRLFKEYKAKASRLLKVFEIPYSNSMQYMANKVLQKDFRVYLFDKTDDKVHDISNLDPGSPDKHEAGWGGLSEFSGHVADIIAEVVAEHEKMSCEE